MRYRRRASCWMSIVAREWFIVTFREAGFRCQSPRYTTERSSAIVQKYRRHECNHLRAPYPNRLSYVQSQSLAARRIYGWKENPTDGYPQSAAPFAGHYQSE